MVVARADEGEATSDDQKQDADIDFAVRREFKNKNIKKAQSVKLKNGPRVIKQATLLSIGDPESDEVKKTSLLLRTFGRKKQAEGGGYDFTQPTQSWYLDGDSEIKALQVLLNEQLPETGMYQALSKDEKRNEVSRTVLEGGVDADAIASFVGTISGNTAAQELLAETPLASVLADAVTLHQQRTALDELAAVAEDSSKNEHDLQAILDNQWWIFGGRFIDRAKRRAFTALEQLDIPLLRPDGSLHIVELKQANIPRLIVEDHGKPVVGPDVHLAVTQAMNYLNAFDEQRAQILKDFAIDSHRASVTIVIGHSKFVNAKFSATQMNEALRTYNSHLSRIQVVTYDELIDSARRSLDLAK